MKTKSIFFCTSCGYESNGYLGRCSACGTWGSFKEASFDKPSKKSAAKERELFIAAESELLTLDQIKENEISRLDTKSEEFNRVMGGGIVPGSLTLLGGEPGIGKSTILLQIASNFAQNQLKVLYISAEESSRQLKLRASRLNVKSSENILIFAESNLKRILQVIESEEPSLVIVDSIQAIYNDSLDSVPGSPSQIREGAGKLMRLAKSTNVPIVLVGHINKEGDIAGPKILEHMVDTVIQFEGSRDSSIRFLRTIKNRFGSTDEIGIFRMESTGLADLGNPSEVFLQERSGGVIIATKEGRRTLLLEIQALVVGSDYHNPRRLANGIGIGRLHQILAVLEKQTGLELSKADVYLNVVGGLNISEPAADLAVAIAIYNSARKIKNTNDLVALGELGLNGEIRSVTDIEARIKECQKLGFNNIIIPEGNMKKFINGERIISAKNLAGVFTPILQTNHTHHKQ